jgi:hypothetical protein
LDEFFAECNPICVGRSRLPRIETSYGAGKLGFESMVGDLFAAFEESHQINSHFFPQCGRHRRLAVSPGEEGQGAIFLREISQGNNKIIEGGEQDLFARVL